MELLTGIEGQQPAGAPDGTRSGSGIASALAIAVCQEAAWQDVAERAGASSRDGPGALSCLRVVEHTREQPAQLDRGRELAVLLEDGSDLRGNSAGDRLRGRESSPTSDRGDHNARLKSWGSRGVGPRLVCLDRCPHAPAMFAISEADAAAVRVVLREG